MRESKLKLNSDKTGVMIASKTDFFSKTIVLPTLDGMNISLSDFDNNLGVILSPVLLFDKEAGMVVKTTFLNCI